MNKSLPPQIFCNALSILNYFPGYIACMDRENRYNYYVNDQCAYVNGYENVEEIYETRMDAIRCKAAESAHLWIEQNQMVLKTNNPMKILDIHAYRNDEIKILFSQKIPILDDKYNP